MTGLQHAHIDRSAAGHQVGPRRFAACRLGEELRATSEGARRCRRLAQRHAWRHSISASEPSSSAKCAPSPDLPNLESAGTCALLSQTDLIVGSTVAARWISPSSSR